MSRFLGRTGVLVVLLALGACGAVGDIDTAAMQTTNRAVGAPPNGPGNPPPPPRQSGL
jgi:hypothetical protein